MKSVLVSGAAGGLGAPLCRAFLAAGHAVFGLVREAAPPADLLADPRCRFHPADLSAAGFSASVPPEFFEVDVLVNNASPRPDLAITHKRPLEDFERQWAVGVRAPVELLGRCMKSLLARRGAVVHVLSAYTLQAPPKGLAPYISQKHALLGLGLALRAELAGRGVRVLNVSPRVMDTAFLAGLPQAVRADLRAGDTLDPDEAARRIVALAAGPGVPDEPNILI